MADTGQLDRLNVGARIERRLDLLETFRAHKARCPACAARARCETLVVLAVAYAEAEEAVVSAFIDGAAVPRSEMLR